MRLNQDDKKPLNEVNDHLHALHSRRSATSDEFESVLTAGTKSHYAWAGKRCFRYIEAASLFFEDDIDRDGLSKRLDIGKPGSDGKSV